MSNPSIEQVEEAAKKHGLLDDIGLKEGVFCHFATPVKLLALITAQVLVRLSDWQAAKLTKPVAWELTSDVIISKPMGGYINEQKLLLSGAKIYFSEPVAITREPDGWAEEGKPANVISAYLKSVNKSKWTEAYTVPLYRGKTKC